MPADVKEFRIEIGGTRNEPVTADLIAPDGKTVDSVKDLQGTKLFTVTRDPREAGVWQILVKHAFEDHFIRMGNPLVPVLSFDPGQVLVEKKR